VKELMILLVRVGKHDEKNGRTSSDFGSFKG